MKKLTLNKETISNLSNKQASKIIGGITSPCPVSGYSQVDQHCITDCPDVCLGTLDCLTFHCN